MATLTQDMKDMIGAQLNYLATADEMVIRKSALKVPCGFWMITT